VHFALLFTARKCRDRLAINDRYDGVPLERNALECRLEDTKLEREKETRHAPAAMYAATRTFSNFPVVLCTHEPRAIGVGREAVKARAGGKTDSSGEEEPCVNRVSSAFLSPCAFSAAALVIQRAIGSQDERCYPRECVCVCVYPSGFPAGVTWRHPLCEPVNRDSVTSAT